MEDPLSLYEVLMLDAGWIAAVIGATVVFGMMMAVPLYVFGAVANRGRSAPAPDLDEAEAPQAAA